MIFKLHLKVDNANLFGHSHISVVVARSSKLSRTGRDTTVSASEVYVRTASIWEATIKVGIDKLDVDAQQLVTEIENSGSQELPISAKHAACGAVA